MAHHPSGEWDYVGDAEILRLLDESQQAFKAGDKAALMMCVFRCAAFQAVIPEWAADALIALRENLDNGRARDFNDAFGVPAKRVNTRAAKVRKDKAKSDVLAEMVQLRTKGSSFNDDEMFSQVVTNLREKGVNVNHRDVQEIYKADGGFLKTIPRKPNLNDIYGSVQLTRPRARRRGRSILRDEEAD